MSAEQDMDKLSKFRRVFSEMSNRSHYDGGRTIPPSLPVEELPSSWFMDGSVSIFWSRALYLVDLMETARVRANNNHVMVRHALPDERGLFLQSLGPIPT